MGPHLLALDTSTDCLAVGLARAQAAMGGERNRRCPRVGAPDRAGAGTDRTRATVLAAARRHRLRRGPGAFTGLRTACAVAQGLAFGRGKPSIAVDSLMIVAEDARQQLQTPPMRIWVAMDARMGEVYAACYRWRAGKWLVGACAVALDALARPGRLRRPRCGRLGHRRLRHAAALRRLRTLIAGQRDRAAALLRLAQRQWRARGRGGPGGALPLYLRDKVALTTAERQASAGAATNPHEGRGVSLRPIALHDLDEVMAVEAVAYSFHGRAATSSIRSPPATRREASLRKAEWLGYLRGHGGRRRNPPAEPHGRAGSTSARATPGPCSTNWCAGASNVPRHGCGWRCVPATSGRGVVSGVWLRRRRATPWLLPGGPMGRENAIVMSLVVRPASDAPGLSASAPCCGRWACPVGAGAHSDGPAPARAERAAALPEAPPAPVPARPPRRQRSCRGGGGSRSACARHRHARWPALREAVAACRACGLCQGRTPDGVRRRPSAGALDDRRRGAGRAGGPDRANPSSARRAAARPACCARCGLTRGEATPERQVYIANTLKCRPPRNRNPEPDELALCEPVPDAPDRAGAARASSWRWAASRCRRCCAASEPIGKLRGRVHRYQGVPLVVTYHPAYLLRNLADKARAWDDLCLAARRSSRRARDRRVTPRLARRRAQVFFLTGRCQPAIVTCLARATVSCPAGASLRHGASRRRWWRLRRS